MVKEVMKRLLFFIFVIVIVSSRTGLGCQTYGNSPIDDSTVLGLMKDNQIPGLSLTLIENGKIVFSKGYGKTRGVFGRAVDSETLFQVASISKPVAAAVALQLVEKGVLSLDAPVLEAPVVVSYLPKPYLESSEKTDSITLHQILNHTSGLSNNLFPKDKRLVNNPGEKFLYSGIGFDYLTEVIRLSTGKTLQAEALELLFDKAGMKNSSFKMPFMMKGNVAPPSMPVMYHIVVFLVPFLLLVLVFTLLLAVCGRILKKQKIVQRYFWAVLIAAVAAELIIVAVLLVKLVPIVLISAVLFVAVFLVLTKVVKKQKFAFLATIFIWIILALIPVQLPFDITPPGESAAYSLVSNSAELGKFVQCMLDDSQTGGWKTMLKKDLMIKPSEYWGLGIGLCEYEGKTFAWHTGINTGATSLFVVDLENKKAVVCVTNGNNGIKAASELVAEYLGVDKNWDVGM